MGDDPMMESKEAGGSTARAVTRLSGGLRWLVRQAKAAGHDDTTAICQAAVAGEGGGTTVVAQRGRLWCGSLHGQIHLSVTRFLVHIEHFRCHLNLTVTVRRHPNLAVIVRYCLNFVFVIANSLTCRGMEEPFQARSGPIGSNSASISVTKRKKYTAGDDCISIVHGSKKVEATYIYSKDIMEVALDNKKLCITILHLWLMIIYQFQHPSLIDG